MSSVFVLLCTLLLDYSLTELLRQRKYQTIREFRLKYYITLFGDVLVMYCGLENGICNGTVFVVLPALSQKPVPILSLSVPHPAQYFASTMMIVGLSVVVTVLVLQFHHHDPHGGKMPKWVGYHRYMLHHHTSTPPVWKGFGRCAVKLTVNTGPIKLIGPVLTHKTNDVFRHSAFQTDLLTLERFPIFNCLW